MGRPDIRAVLAYGRQTRGPVAPAPGDTLSDQPEPEPRPQQARPQQDSAQPPAEPATYTPGYAQLPPQMNPDYPPTSEFPAVGTTGTHLPDDDRINYAPPGYTPDYGRPHPQRGYAGPPPQGYPGYGPPAPRRSNVPLIAVILAVAVLLCGGTVTALVLATRNLTDKAKAAAAPYLTPQTTAPQTTGPAQDPQPGPTDLPTTDPGETSSGSDTIKVTYEVTGDGPATILYLRKLGESPTRVEQAKLPWKFTTTMQKPAVLSVIAMRTDTTKEGEVTCRTLVDGQEVRKTSSGTGLFATAACSYVAFD